MNFSTYFKLYLLTIPVFFAIDILWLGVVAKKFYQNYLGHLLADQVNWMAAIIFYLMYIAGIIYFAVGPALEKNVASDALLKGAVFGFITYATYDFTNWATLKNWPTTVVFVDVLWGTVLGGLVAIVSFYLGKWLLQ